MAFRVFGASRMNPFALARLSVTRLALTSIMRVSDDFTFNLPFTEKILRQTTHPKAPYVARALQPVRNE